MKDIAYYRNLVILAGLGPLVMLGWDAWKDQLGANGVNNALHITGILSLVFLFISLIVSPLRAVTGWNSLIAYRRALGLYGFVYAVLHFGIYIALDRMGNLASTFEEIVSRRFLMVGFIGLALMLPLAVTSTNAMIKKLGPVRWKLLHRLSYVAAVLGVVHYYMLVKSDVRQPLAFAAALTPILGFRSVKHYLDLRRDASRSKSVPLTLPQTGRRFWNGELVVANIQRETHDVKTFRLICAAGEIPFVHRPGQYMTLTLVIDGQAVKRSYTIASSPTQRGHVELTIKRNPKGLVSRFMHEEVKIGDRIRVAAPAGKFFFDDLNSPAVVLIGGGVGITPLMSILRNLIDRSWGGTIYFINALRSKDDMIYSLELPSLARRFENLRVMQYFSQPDPVADDSSSAGQWQSRSGYISAEDLLAFVPDLKHTPIFLCGPDPMMVSVRKMILSMGIPNEQISSEEFLSPTVTTSTNKEDQNESTSSEKLNKDVQSVAIEFTVSKQTIDIDRATTILDAAEQAGISLPWECRAGICGQCKVRCTSGGVKMLSRDALSNAEQAGGLILACQSYPVTESISIDA